MANHSILCDVAAGQVNTNAQQLRKHVAVRRYGQAAERGFYVGHFADLQLVGSGRERVRQRLPIRFLKLKLGKINLAFEVARTAAKGEAGGRHQLALAVLIFLKDPQRHRARRSIGADQKSVPAGGQVHGVLLAAVDRLILIIAGVEALIIALIGHVQVWHAPGVPDHFQKRFLIGRRLPIADLGAANVRLGPGQQPDLIQRAPIRQLQGAQKLAVGAGRAAGGQFAGAEVPIPAKADIAVVLIGPLGQNAFFRRTCRGRVPAGAVGDAARLPTGCGTECQVRRDGHRQRNAAGVQRLAVDIRSLHIQVVLLAV